MFIRLTSMSTAKNPIVINFQNVTALHVSASGGTFIYVVGQEDPFQVQEPLDRVVELVGIFAKFAPTEHATSVTVAGGKKTDA